MTLRYVRTPISWGHTYLGFRIVGLGRSWPESSENIRKPSENRSDYTTPQAVQHTAQEEIVDFGGVERGPKTAGAQKRAKKHKQKIDKEGAGLNIWNL